MDSFGQEERDLLIGMSINVENISVTQGKMEKKLDGHIENEREFLTKRVWMWATAGLSSMFCLLVFGAYSYTYKTDAVHDMHSKDYSIHRTSNVINVSEE
jgi:hypothetical protein